MKKFTISLGFLKKFHPKKVFNRWLGRPPLGVPSPVRVKKTKPTELQTGLRKALKNQNPEKMKSAFKIIALILKYATLIVAITNILAVTVEEIKEKFPEVLEDDEEEDFIEEETKEDANKA